MSVSLTLDQLVQEILQDSGTEPKNVKRVQSLLKDAPESVLATCTSDLDPLALLDSKTNSLAYLYFLTARCLAATEDNAVILLQMLRDFIAILTPSLAPMTCTRIHYIPKALEHLAHALKNPMITPQVLYGAIDCVRPNRCTLTAFHAPFAKSCLLAKAYTFALRILDDDIQELGAAPGVSIREYLEYHYYGAMLYIGNKQFDRALDFLSLVVSAPTTEALRTISAIQIEGLKKFVIVSLIHKGALQPLPKYTSPTLQRVFKARHDLYYMLAEAFECTAMTTFNDLLQTHRSKFEADKHLGLLQQCTRALYEKKIKELARVYMTLRLDDFSSKLGGSMDDDQVERLILHMIDSSRITARIEYTSKDQTKLVHFYEEDLTQSSRATEDLYRWLASAAAVSDRVSKLDNDEGLSKEFQKKSLSQSAKARPMALNSGDEDTDAPTEDDGILS